MSSAARAATAVQEGSRRNAWERGAAGWHAAFALVLVATLGVTLAEAISPVRKVAATALLVILAVWYASVGRAAMHRHGGRLSAAYLGGSLVLVVPLFLVTPAAWILLFALCPQSFAALPIRRITIATVGVLGVAAASVVSYWPGRDREVLLWAIVVLAVGVVLSLMQQHWIGRIVAESRERAELIDRLEGTQAELAEAQRQAGALLERERLAGEIHDTLAQGFSSILMLLQAAEFEIRSDPGEAERHVELARHTAYENLAEARALVAALTPVSLNATTLDEALGRLVDRFGAELPLNAELSIDGAAVRPLARDSEVVLLRAAQEALANVRKHAESSGLRVRLCYDETVVGLVIADDGKGFDPALSHGGFGLHGMRRRLEQIGGSVEIESSPGSGTTVRVRVPA